MWLPRLGPRGPPCIAYAASFSHMSIVAHCLHTVCPFLLCSLLRCFLSSLPSRLPLHMLIPHHPPRLGPVVTALGHATTHAASVTLVVPSLDYGGPATTSHCVRAVEGDIGACVCAVWHPRTTQWQVARTSAVTTAHAAAQHAPLSTIRVRRLHPLTCSHSAQSPPFSPPCRHFNPFLSPLLLPRSAIDSLRLPPIMPPLLLPVALACTWASDLGPAPWREGPRPPHG